MESEINTAIKQRPNFERTPQSSNTPTYTKSKYKIDHSQIKDLLLEYQSNQLDIPQTHQLMELVYKQITSYCAEVFSPQGMKSKFAKNYRLNLENYDKEELANESILRIFGTNPETGKKTKLETLCKKIKENIPLDSLLRVEVRSAIGDHITREKTDERYAEYTVSQSIRKDRAKLEQRIGILENQGVPENELSKIRNNTKLGYYLPKDSLDIPSNDRLDISPENNNNESLQLQVSKEYGVEPQVALENKSNLLNPIIGTNYLYENMIILTPSERKVMEIKIQYPEKNQTQISIILKTTSESVRQLINSSVEKYKVFSQNTSKRKELEYYPSVNISDYENIGFTKAQMNKQKERIMNDLLEIKNITSEEIREISNLKKSYVGTTITKKNKQDKTTITEKPETK
jgi:DNA-binding CsgD family transcriptional regulator